MPARSYFTGAACALHRLISRDASHSSSSSFGITPSFASFSEITPQSIFSWVRRFEKCSRFHCENSVEHAPRAIGLFDRFRSYAAMPNSSAMKVACAMASSFDTHLALPFRIIFTASIPCNVRQALKNEPYPFASHVRFFTVRWSCSTSLCRLPDYAACLVRRAGFAGGGLVFAFGAIGIIRDFPERSEGHPLA